jgi:DNA-binding response OmpR family regulator
MNQASILVIEDDEIVAKTIEKMPAQQRLPRPADIQRRRRAASRQTEVPDLIILDVIMPGMNGYSVCREVRNDSLLSEVPILFLTAKAKDEDKIAGFNAGADDYLAKPFNIDELVFRIRAVLRRTYGSKQRETKVQPEPAIIQKTEKSVVNSAIIAVGDYRLNTKTFELQAPDKRKIRLTPVQYDLLYHLMNHPGEIFSPSRLLDEVWDYPTDTGSPDLVRVHIKNLRERIENDPKNPVFIKTVADTATPSAPYNVFRYAAKDRA